MLNRVGEAKGGIVSAACGNLPTPLLLSGEAM